jgi:hypothetical protein
MRNRLLGWTATGLIAIGSTAPAPARLVRIIIEKREAVAPAKPGAPQYEILRGHFEGELDPRDLHNRIITDLDRAPLNARGRVEYSATFAISRPSDLRHASRVLFYDVANRGNARVAADEDGHVRVVSGWQGDIAPRTGLQTIKVPTAKDPAGTPLTSLALARFTDMAEGAQTLPITAGLGGAAARPLPLTLDTRDARLFRQADENGPRQGIEPEDWAFADCTTLPFPGKPDPTKLCLRGKFEQHYAYTLVYRAKDPLVLGMGFAATRDLVAFLRRGSADDDGHPSPLAGEMRWAVASGTSQSGNFLKSFVNLGFNADEQGKRVFDAINPNIAARQLPMNIRFGVPGGAADAFEPGSEGVLWWHRYRDGTRKRGVGSLLDRCTVSRTCPKIVETFGSAEFWGLRMSPGLVGTDASADLPLPSNVRRYYFPGVTHGGSFTGGFPIDGDKAALGIGGCILAGNPNPSTDTLRALQKAMVAWVVESRPPPPSRYPMLASGDLVKANAAAMGWPSLPGVPLPDGKLNALPDYDFGSGFDYKDLSGVITRQPPAERRMIPLLVPRVDEDGNETAGVPSVQALVPIGTYTGWNVRARGWGKGTGCGFVGGFVPFARTKAQRLASGDPRRSLEERYGSHAGFVARVRAVADERVAAGWLLAEDAARLVQQADASAVLN